MLRRITTAALLAVSLSAFAARQGGPIPVQLPLFPGNNWWNTDITSAPVDTAKTTTYVSFIGSTTRVRPDFGGDAGDGSGEIYGIPFIIVDNTQPLVPIAFTDYGDESDPGPYPIPDEPITQFAWIEGGEPGNQDPGGDRHMLILNRSDNTLYEMGNVFYDGAGWQASGGAIFHVDTNDRRPETWTSADAAGLAILPGLVRYDELIDLPEINHAFRVTVSSTNGHVFPASHTAGNTTNAPPMGTRFRLKAGVNPAGVTNPYALKIITALKRYGLIVADNGSNLFMTGAYDTRWNVDDLIGTLLSSTAGLRALQAQNFEVVQEGWQPPTVLLVTAPLSGGTSQNVTVKAVGTNGAVQTGYRGTVNFTANPAGASLPSNYTFTAADNGVHVFTIGSPTGLALGYTSITAKDIATETITGSVLLSSGPRKPAGVVASVAGATQINVSWEAPVGGAASYIVQRRTPSTAYATAPCTVVGTTCQDFSAPGPAAYIYRVCSETTTNPDVTCSIPDVAGNLTFTNDPIIPGVTTVQAAHITELQNAANAMLASPRSFTPASSNAAIQAIQLQEISDAIDDARQALGLAPYSRHDAFYDDTVFVKAPNVQELRNATK